VRARSIGATWPWKAVEALSHNLLCHTVACQADSYLERAEKRLHVTLRDGTSAFPLKYIPTNMLQEGLLNFNHSAT
jgi:hypothetical protein